MPPDADTTPPDLQHAARRLAESPLIAKESDPDTFKAIRRHHQQLASWFSARFRYRLVVTADTARLYKDTTVPTHRPLLTTKTNQRAFRRREYTVLALAIAAAAEARPVVSLRDLIAGIHRAGSEADITITAEYADRRAVVTGIQWLIHVGAVAQIDKEVDAYASDDDADALLRVNHDRLALLPMAALTRSQTAEQLLDRSDSRHSTRTWLRALILEEPVVYRDELTEHEWSELRRRLRDDARMFQETFDLDIEARAEGAALIDPDAELTPDRFPVPGRTEHQAALLLLERLAGMEGPTSRDDALDIIGSLAQEHKDRWAQETQDHNTYLDRVTSVLERFKLLRTDRTGALHLLPAAHRYTTEVSFQDTLLPL